VNSLEVNKSTTLTKLERKWYNEYLKDFDQLEAMRRLKKSEIAQGLITDDCTRQLAYQTKKSCLQKLHISADDIREKMGLVKDNLDKRLIAKFDAKDTVILQKVIGKDGLPASVKVDNHVVQLKALELAYKLTGELSNKVELTGKDGEALKLSIVAGIGFIPTRE
jgi:hypothetical protein